jgi:hypothetical protein
LPGQDSPAIFTSDKRPFPPFEIRVDGEVIPVARPEQVLFAEAKTTLIVVYPGDHVHILDVDQISKVRLLPRQVASASRSKPGS